MTDDDPNTLALSDASHDELWNRIREALDVAINYGQTDGDHHKLWVIDQMVRHLTGCPVEQGHGVVPSTGEPFTFDTLGRSADYEEFIRVYSYDPNADPEDDEEWGYTWDEGIAP